MVQNINKQKDHELINIINTINMQNGCPLVSGKARVKSGITTWYFS